jgi:kanamycin kinase
LNDSSVYRFHIRQPSPVTVPSAPMPVPAVVAAIAAGRPVTPVWVNELGGVTFDVGGGLEFVKVSRPRWAPHLVAEAERLRWAADFHRVPRVLGEGDGWLHTEGLPGRSAVDARWVAAPRTAARAIGAGLRLLHDALPVDTVPFGPPPWVTYPYPTSCPTDRLVVCHGDACAPNTLIDDDGRCCGHVDLGDLGVADRWADLAIAMLSLPWNYPGSWEGDLLDAYGVERDEARIDHYQRLWNAGDVSSH